MCVTWLIHMCDVTHSYMWHDSFVRVTWRIRTCDMTTSYVWHDVFICVIWRIWCVQHESSTYVTWDWCICETWLIYTWDVTHLYVCHDWCICVTWLIHTCDVTHSYLWHDSFIHVTCLICKCDMTYMCSGNWFRKNTYIWMSHVTGNSLPVTWLIHMYVWHDSFICMCGMPHSHVCVQAIRFARAGQFIACDMTHSYVCMTWLIHIYVCRQFNTQEQATKFFRMSDFPFSWILNMYICTNL